MREITVRRVRNLTIVDAYIRDEKGNGMKATWFNAPYMKNTLHRGDVFIFRGFVHENRGSYVMDQPKTFSFVQYQKKMGEMQPVYPLVSGLTNNMVLKAVKQAFNLVKKSETIPLEIRKIFQLQNVEDALYNIHFPKTNNDFTIARKRLVFEEFFHFIITLRKLKETNDTIKNYH